MGQWGYANTFGVGTVRKLAGTIWVGLSEDQLRLVWVGLRSHRECGAEAGGFGGMKA
jgi:hypothetical protein